VRRRLRARQLPAGMRSGGLDEARLSSDQRVLVELLQHLAFSLERIDRRIERLATSDSPEPEATPAEITLSGTGFSTPTLSDLAKGTWVEATLDLPESGLPLIPCLAEIIGREENGYTALRFEEIAPEDRERIIQLSLRTQSRELRHERNKETK